MAAIDSGTQLSSLPQDTVLRILSHMSQRELHRTALVSRFFRSCVSSSGLCREREVCIRGGSAAGLQSRLQRLSSLVSWLRSHGQHLRSLRLKDSGVLPLQELPVLEGYALAAGVSCTQLEELSIQFDAAAVAPSWAALLTALRRLALFSSTRLLPPSGLEGLQRCTQLALYGRQSEVACDTRLPPNLRELMLGTLQGGELPNQLGELAALHTLELWGDWRGTSTLSRLASLRHLHITGPGYVPRELSTLTGLQSLLVAYDCHSEPPWRHPDGNVERLRAACLQLTRLTSLALCLLPGNPLPDDEMEGLSRLRRFYSSLCCWETTEVPPGPWLASLTWLAADSQALLRSTAVLAAATALTRLTLMDVHGGDADEGWEPAGPSSYQATMREDVTALYEWVQSLPLRRLTFVGGAENSIDLDMFRGALALKAARPEIEIDCFPAGRDPAFEEEFFYHGLDDLVPRWREAVALTEPYQYPAA